MQQINERSGPVKFSRVFFFADLYIFLNFKQGLKARGNVEEWLGKVEESMFQNIRRLIKSAITDYNQRSREEWVVSHGHQV